MQIAISGLGKMGHQLTQKLIEDGHEVVGHDHDTSQVDRVKELGATLAYSKEEVVQAFNGNPVVLWIMIPHQVVDSEIDDWVKHLPADSIIIDGGNSDYRGDQARAEKITAAGSHALDIGTSGGVWGMKNGFSMMVGGSKPAYHTIEPILQTLAKPHGGYRYFGTHGAGHYVKMVHNAIEYGMMQSIAEGYRILKEGPYQDLNLAEAGDVWQEGSVVNSWLNDLTRQALHENPTLDNIEGVVAESGETRWTLETADQLGIPMPSIQASFDVRLASQEPDAAEKGAINYATKLLAAMRNKFGGHNIDGKQ